MTQFALLAALLIGATLALLLPPLWLARQREQQQADQKALNLGIFRDQLAELEKERAEGMLSTEDFEQSKSELQRRLLDEVGDATPPAASAHQPSRALAIALLVTLPILSLVGYTLLGNPRALEPQTQTRQPQMTPEQIQAMVQRLADKMQQNPDDLQGWVMLGRSYKSLGRYDDAVNAFAKAEKLINDEPDLLASYAETIALSKGEGFKGKPRKLVERALKLDPKHPHSLFLAGAAAMEAGENKKGVAYWEALLPFVEPDSDIEKMLKQGIAKMQKGK